VVLSSAVLPSAQALQFNIPSRAPVQCIPYPAIWTGGVAPYTFSIVPGSQGPPIEQFPNLSENRFTWSSDLAGGTSIFLKVEDATGASVESQLMSMEDGLRSDCLKGTPHSEGATGGSATATGAPTRPSAGAGSSGVPSATQVSGTS
ncbi:hypothetical protein BD413DRAFT_457464, partial [Trametes elegans]